MDRLEGIMDTHMTVLRSTYGESACVYVDNTDTGSSMRIIFDPNDTRAHRQGVHTSLESIQCEYDLAERMERAMDDGFDTIWVH